MWRRRDDGVEVWGGTALNGPNVAQMWAKLAEMRQKK